MSVFASLKQFDAYSKPVEDFRERTVTGEFFFQEKTVFRSNCIIFDQYNQIHSPRLVRVFLVSFGLNISDLSKKN